MTDGKSSSVWARRARKYQLDIDGLRSLLVRSERRLELALDEVSRCHARLGELEIEARFEDK